MFFTPIPFAGPSITHRDIERVASAVASGWHKYERAAVVAFQHLMGRYVGREFALATSSRLGALHLAMLALDIGPGDEVLVPEIADISLAFSVLHVGAKPVFCDVDPQTLCLCPASAAARVTSATKAMIPAHMYGVSCAMTPLSELAQDRNIAIIEDATQGLGAMHAGRMAGTFGIFSVYGFDVQETLICGGGGMLLASDSDRISKAAKFGHQGESASNPFVYDAVGYNYAMSNLQAALGAAQAERLEVLVEKKKQIHTWYAERLASIPDVRMNADTSEAKATAGSLMPVLFINDASVLRTEFMQRLMASGVQCRPVYYPLSSMPMFCQADNPVTYSTGVRALLLPCGDKRTEEEVDYVASIVKKLLANGRLSRVTVEPKGWLKYKIDILNKFVRVKQDGLTLPFVHEGKEYALQAITAKDAKDPNLIKFMADFRRENMHAFFTHNQITDDAMSDVLDKYIQTAYDMLLFWVVGNGIKFGHMGLDNFDFLKRECLAEALMMRSDAPRGLSIAASNAMFAWAKASLGIKRVFNHVVGSNRKVRLMAASLGFKELNRISLYSDTLSNGDITFRPMYIPGHDTPEEYFVTGVKKL